MIQRSETANERISGFFLIWWKDLLGPLTCSLYFPWQETADHGAPSGPSPTMGSQNQGLQDLVIFVFLVITHWKGKKTLGIFPFPNIPPNLPFNIDGKYHFPCPIMRFLWGTPSSLCCFRLLEAYCSDGMPCFPIALFGALFYQLFPPCPRVHRFNASKHSISSGDYNEFLYIMGFPGSSDKESACNTGDVGLIPGLGRSPGEKDGYPL